MPRCCQVSRCGVRKLHYSPEDAGGYALCGERGRYVGPHQAWVGAFTTNDPFFVTCDKPACAEPADAECDRLDLEAGY